MLLVLRFFLVDSSSFLALWFLSFYSDFNLTDLQCLRASMEVIVLLNTLIIPGPSPPSKPSIFLDIYPSIQLKLSILTFIWCFSFFFKEPNVHSASFHWVFLPHLWDSHPAYSVCFLCSVSPSFPRMQLLLQRQLFFFLDFPSPLIKEKIYGLTTTARTQFLLSIALVIVWIHNVP